LVFNLNHCLTSIEMVAVFVEEGMMDFLGIGGGEILVILLVVLLLWGPNRIVEISRTLGKTVHSFRKAASDISTQISREVEEQKKQVPQEKPGKNDGSTISR
jgi:sec-independent protein translocase protein TatA